MNEHGRHTTTNMFSVFLARVMFTISSQPVVTHGWYCTQYANNIQACIEQALSKSADCHA